MVSNRTIKFQKIYYFQNLRSLYRFLGIKKYDLGIQGGTSIINKKVFDKYKLGILKIHPGLLPQYRGCCSRKIYENKNVFSTCHIIDEGIDTGKIVAKKQLTTNNKSYYHFRASIYKIFSYDQIKNIKENKGFVNKPYDQGENSIYRKYIGEKKIEYIRIY